jgi:Glycosyl hydrolase family 63 C-terminal domain
MTMTMTTGIDVDPERERLLDDERRTANWKRWGPYLAERQWGTVREDYSADGTNWDYFPHDHARSRVYRWGEDGLLGISDREGRLCFALALWNGRDPILKERLFGLSGPEGNHGEDVKEEYFYLDSTPTHSYLKALYKYPHAVFPYGELVEENRRRGVAEREYELGDTGVFDGDRYFDVLAEYAKQSPDDILIRVTVCNRGPTAERLHLLPTFWARNTWSWGRIGEGYWPRPRFTASGPRTIVAEHASLGRYFLELESPPGADAELLFTDNETNAERLFDSPSSARHVKDAFHEHVVHGRPGAVNPDRIGTKAAAHYTLDLPPGGERVIRLRLFAEADAVPDERRFGADFDRTFALRIAEADRFYDGRIPACATDEERRVARQAYAGLLWNKQFYHYDVKAWLEGDPAQPPPPDSRRAGRNAQWHHLYNRDVVSMPDKWEFPWYAAWDLAFHMLPLARVDAHLAKQQLILLLREWYLHPSGQLPAYEFAFGDVNPPVHAWAAWRVYKISGPAGERDVDFLARIFHKLLLNFTWWVNRKDHHGKNLFSGGFLGLDNIGVFDRSAHLPTGGDLEQADGTAWMAFYCLTMLSMALELACHDRAYDDLASKFFEHFVGITEAINTLGGTGLWSEEDGFYYDQLHVDGWTVPLRLRSMVGLVPLIAVETFEEASVHPLTNFRKRSRWFLEHRADLARHVSLRDPGTGHGRVLLAVPSRDRLARVLRYMLDETEFLSPYGIRSLSRVYGQRPYVFAAAGAEYVVKYAPGESTTGLFGGNSNWRGPIWFPLNYLLVEALERYHNFYGDSFKVELPTGSGRFVTLEVVARELDRRLVMPFLPDARGNRPCLGGDPRWTDPAWKDLLLFHEHFHGDDGRGLGATHQTGWTSLVIRCIETLCAARVEARYHRS